MRNSCKFFMWEAQHRDYLVEIGIITTDNTCVEDAIPDLLEATSELRADVNNTKHELAGMKTSIPELKDGMDAKDCKIVKLGKTLIVFSSVNLVLVACSGCAGSASEVVKNSSEMVSS